MLDLIDQTNLDAQHFRCRQCQAVIVANSQAYAIKLHKCQPVMEAEAPKPKRGRPRKTVEA